jgi:amino-acid N-acetyltransferase
VFLSEIPIQIRAAIANDLTKIKSLLEIVNLPSDDVDNLLDTFLVWDDAAIHGCVGLEVYNQYALFRSLAVVPNNQGKGIGKALTKSIINKAKDLNVKTIYLLTETAGKFFHKHGFKTILRDEVPVVIKNTSEFSYLCPDSAICMKLEL